MQRVKRRDDLSPSASHVMGASTQPGGPYRIDQMAWVRVAALLKPGAALNEAGERGFDSEAKCLSRCREKLGVGVLQDRGGGFESLLFGWVEMKFDDRLDSAASDDAGRAETDVVKAVLAGHQGGDDEGRALVAEYSFTDACDAGGDGEAGVSL